MVSLPARRKTWARELTFRLGMALTLLVVSTAAVYLDRSAYDDAADGEVSLVDAIYYTTVTITTTGYGDITPVAPHARLLSALIITPMRIAFLVLLVGTTLEVLATEGRTAIRDSRWRKKMKSRSVVIGYGTMGRSAVATLLRNGLSAEEILVIDRSRAAVASANRGGLAAFEGRGTDRELLRRACVHDADEIIITVGVDDEAILTTLTVRQLNPSAHIVVAVRSEENVALVRQSGADGVVTSSASVGRLMGLSSISPMLGQVIEDLLASGEGLDVHERAVSPEEVGLAPGDIRHERVLAVVRAGEMYRFFDPEIAELKEGDDVVVVRQSLNVALDPHVQEESA
jgi:voltage-gated potassium channel